MSKIQDHNPDPRKMLLHRALEQYLLPEHQSNEKPSEKLNDLERDELRLALQDPETQAEFTLWRNAQQELARAPHIAAPPGLASRIAQNIAADAALEYLKSSSRLAPPGFAAQLAARIAEESQPEVEQALRNLSRLKAPANIAPLLASRIARESRGLEEHNPAPLYMVGALLVAVALAVANYAWSNLAGASNVLLELGRSLPWKALLGYGAIMTISALVMIFAKRILQATPQVQTLARWGSVAAFAGVAALSLPTLGQHLGSYALEADKTTASIIRIGGNVQVSGHVTGDVVAFGGSISLLPHAVVDGKIISVLGNVNVTNASLKSDNKESSKDQVANEPASGSNETAIVLSPKVAAIALPKRAITAPITKPITAPSTPPSMVAQVQPEISTSPKITAILGNVQDASLTSSSVNRAALAPADQAPIMAAASAFQPLLELGHSEYWAWVYLAFLAACALLIYQSNYAPELQKSLRKGAVRNLSSGFLVAGIGVPLLLLGSMNSVSSAIAVLGLLVLLALLSAGLALSLTTLGNALVTRFKLPKLEALETFVGLGIFALTLPFPLVAITLWGVGGTLGLGAVLSYLLARARGEWPLSSS